MLSLPAEAVAKAGARDSGLGTREDTVIRWEIVVGIGAAALAHSRTCALAHLRVPVLPVRHRHRPADDKLAGLETVAVEIPERKEAQSW